jgi:GWxTD domain-containing protein
MTVRKSKNTSFILFSVVSLLTIMSFFIQCKSTYTTTGTKHNLAAIYNPASSTIHPVFRVYHNSDQTSLLLIKIFPSELLFNQANVEGEFISKVSIQVQLYEIDKDKPTLADSITYTYNINKKTVEKRFLTQIPLKTEMGKRYQMRIVTRDILRKEFNLSFVEVDKTSEFTEQNFNVVNQNGIPYFNNNIPAGSVFRIEHRNDSLKKLFIDYYKNNTPLPKPTYAMTSEEFFYDRPDSTYILDYSSNLYIAFSYEGLYRYRFDTCQAEGLTIVNLGIDFPRVKTPAEMIDPLAYITTTPEYQRLLDDKNNKLTVDRYWSKIGKNVNRARELIRIYYNRVYFANYYFTNNKPGWKTDRGMVYIMYGPPHDLKKTPDSETWIYSKEGSTNSINFTFSYAPTPFSVNNFILIRSESQEWHWHEAYDAWQRGEIYLAN